MYINGKENAKLTGDRMKILMLSLPLMVRDLIAPEVLSRDIPTFLTQVMALWSMLIVSIILLSSGYLPS